MVTSIAESYDLRPRKRELDASLTIRIASRDRERLERAAAEVGVPAGQLLRAIVRKALTNTAPAGRQQRSRTSES
jgi:predicted DNA binding CopG/RHH family protein